MAAFTHHLYYYIRFLQGYVKHENEYTVIVISQDKYYVIRFIGRALFLRL